MEGLKNEKRLRIRLNPAVVPHQFRTCCGAGDIGSLNIEKERIIWRHILLFNKKPHHLREFNRIPEPLGFLEKTIYFLGEPLFFASFHG